MSEMLTVLRKHASIRTKLFWGMLSVMLTLIVLVTFFSVRTTYQAMYDQLIDNRRTGIDWLSQRLDLQLAEYSDSFYSFEVNKATKADVQIWCETGGTLGYAAKWNIISELNAIMGMNSSINAIELFNLVGGDVLTAKRSGATVAQTLDQLAFWRARDTALQTNLAMYRSQDELLGCHQINRFENGTALALVVFHVKVSALESILSDMRASDDEGFFLFNDERLLLCSSVGDGLPVDETQASLRLPEVMADGERSADDCFWFNRNAGREKVEILQVVPRSVITSVVGRNVLVGLLAAAAAVLAAIGFSLLFSRMFSKPIVALADKMQHVTIRDYDKSNVTQRKDEIGLLENSFDTMVQRNQELIAQKFQTRIEKRSAQLRALQAQINPHFMYNTLQIIGGMAIKKKAPEIYEITVQLSDIMRYSLSFGKEMVPLREEMHYLDSYLGIQNQRFGERIQVDQTIDPVLLDCLIPKLILQPLVENCLEHGLSGKCGTWCITIHGTLDGEDMRLTVSDNGLGMEEERLAYIRGELAKGVENAIGSSAHIGLVNVNSRIRLKYAAHYGVRIQSEQGAGTQVELLLPAQWEEVV